MNLDTVPILRWMSNLRDLGLEYVSHRFYAQYGGEVVECNDNQSQARACVKVGVLGVGQVNPDGSFDPTPCPRRALPTSIYAGQDHGIYFPPEAGDSVWISFEMGDSEKPRYHGSWWRNRDPSRAPKNSEVPNEFKMADPTAAPKKRGIKTAFGHGMLFSDEEASPHVAIWSGQTTTAPSQTGDYKDAIRKQQITLSDTTNAPTVKGVDQTVQEGIYANTFKGLILALNDTKRKIMLSGLRADPEGVSSNAVEIEDLAATVRLKTLGAPGARNEIALNGAAQTISLTTPGELTETALSLTQMVTTLLSQTASAITQTAGVIAQSGALSITLTAPTISLLGGLVVLGPDPKPLMNSDLVDWLKTHTHPVTSAPGATGASAEATALGTPDSSPFATSALRAT